jgi:type I restriction enzyme S subunit
VSDELQFAHYPFEDEDLPESWAIIALENVLENIRPGFASGQHNKDGEGIPHLRPMNISPSGSIDLSEVRYVQGDHSLRLQRGDVLFNNTNSPVWVGKTALIETDDDLAFSNHMTRLRISSAVDPTFIAKQLHFLCSQGYFRHHCKKHVNQASIATDFLSRRVPIRMPPATEQRRIVAKIEALQERSQRAREALAEVGPLLEQFRQSVLAVAFCGDLTADWRAAHPNVEPASELLHRIRVERRRLWEQAELAKYGAKGQKPPKNWQDKYEEPEQVDDFDLPELPAGWVWATVDELTTFITSGSRGWARYYSDAGPLFIRAQNINTDRLIMDDIAHVMPPLGSEGERTRVTRNDLLITITGANVTKAAYVADDIEEAYISQHVALARLVEPTFAKYLHFWTISSANGRAQLLANAYGNGKPGLNLDNIRTMVVALPPIAEQVALLIKVEAMLLKANLLGYDVKVIENDLDQLDQSILAKAFRGQLLPQDANDEPASVLLARIQEQTAQQAEAAKGTKKTTNMQRRDAVRKKSSGLSSPYRLLAEVLTTKGQPMPPQQLLAEAGYDDDSIEDFYFVIA